MKNKSSMVVRFGRILLILLLADTIMLLPLMMTKNLYTGIDMGFHLNRAYDLEQNLKHGNLFPYLSTYSFNHLGTPINMAYGLLPVYPLALGLLIFKNQVLGIYFGIWLIELIAALIAYYCANKYWRNSNKALLFSFCYVFSVFNLNYMIGSFSFGEITAAAFLPMIAYGTYSILVNRGEWWYLAIGMSLVFYTHLLSVLIYSTFVAVLLIIKIIHDKKLDWFKIKQFLYAIIATIFVSAFYLTNFLLVMSGKTGQKISSTMVVDVTSSEIKLSDVIIRSLDNEYFGIIFVLMIFISLFLWGKLSNNARIAFMIGTFFVIFSTPAFDVFWRIVNKTPFVMIQMPYRFMMISNFCFAILVSEVIYLWIDNSGPKLAFNFKIFLALGCILFTTLSWSTTFLNSVKSNQVLSKPTIGHHLPFNNYKVTSDTFSYLTSEYYDGVGDTDYWPVQSYKLSSREKEQIKQDVALTDNHQIKTTVQGIPDGVNLSFKVTNNHSVDLPFFYFNQLRVKVNGKLADYQNSSRGTVLIKNVPNGIVHVRIAYQPYLLNEIMAIVSVISFILLIIYGKSKLLFTDKKQ